VTVNSHQSYSSLGRVLEPNADTLKETSNLVREIQADLGIAHDGDGDRVVIIDEKGRVAQDQVLSSLALKILLEDRRGGTVVLSVNTSSSVEELAEEMGFKVVRSRLGKTFLEMKKVGGVLATEPSKVTDSTWGMWEDGIYVATRIVQHISNSDYNLSNLVNAIPSNFYYQKNIQLHGIDRAKLEKDIWNRYGKDRVEEMDGWKITFDDRSSIMFRISGTEPKARVYVDSPSEKRAMELLKEGLKTFEDIRKHIDEKD
jgi:phosphomannomutase